MVYIENRIGEASIDGEVTKTFRPLTPEERTNYKKMMDRVYELRRKALLINKEADDLFNSYEKENKISWIMNHGLGVEE